jgi:hypothetical protein
LASRLANSVPIPALAPVITAYDFFLPIVTFSRLHIFFNYNISENEEQARQQKEHGAAPCSLCFLL